MHTIEGFISLSPPEQLSILRSEGKVVLRTAVDGRHFTYYVYSNFFVEVEYENGDAAMIHLEAFRGGPKVMQILRVLKDAG